MVDKVSIIDFPDGLNRKEIAGIAERTFHKFSFSFLIFFWLINRVDTMAEEKRKKQQMALMVGGAVAVAAVGYWYYSSSKTSPEEEGTNFDTNEDKIEQITISGDADPVKKSDLNNSFDERYIVSILSIYSNFVTNPLFRNFLISNTYTFAQQSRV